MHNIKDIRKNFDEFVNSIKKRNQDLKLENILELDKKNRNLIQNKEILEKEKKDISKSKDKSLFDRNWKSLNLIEFFLSVKVSLLILKDFLFFSKCNDISLFEFSDFL